MFDFRRSFRSRSRPVIRPTPRVGFMVIVMVASLLAGCISPEDAPAPDAVTPPEVPTGFPRFGESVAALEPCSGRTCWEPAVAVDAQGRIFVVEAGEWAMSARPVAPVAVSTDGGLTFTQVPAPPPVTTAPPGTKVVYGDIMVHTAPSGRLFWTAIVDLNGEGGPLLDDLPKLRPLNWAIQVAWSDDAGHTWEANQELSGVEDLPDRQWLAFDGGTVYMTFGTVGRGVLISRSDDGGSTWGAWKPVAPPADGPQWGGSGPPVVDGSGTVSVASCNMPGLGTTVFRSSDRGVTFTSTTIPIGCGAFPILAARGPHLVLAVYNRYDGNLYVVRSPDGGTHFGEPVRWGETIVTSPWPIIRADGSLAVAWYQFIGGAATALHVTVGDTHPRDDVIVAKVVVPADTDRTEAALTHFAHGVLTPDEKLVVTWVDGPRVRVASESAG